MESTPPTPARTWRTRSSAREDWRSRRRTSCRAPARSRSRRCAAASSCFRLDAIDATRPQGDALAGIISRKDLAEVAVEACASPALRDATFELYYTKGAQPCEGKFKKLLADEAFPRLHGDSYAALFKGVRRGGTYDVPA